MLKDAEWKYDVMPELWEGKNIADFVDADIMARLDELEAEEDQLEKEGFYESADEELDNSDNEAIAETATAIRARRDSIRASNHTRKMKSQNQAALPRTSGTVHRGTDGMIQSMQAAGYDTTTFEKRVNSVKAKAAEAGQKRKAAAMEVDSDQDEGDSWADDADPTAMDVDGEPNEGSSKRMKANSGRKVPSGRNFKQAGLKDEAQAKKALQMVRLSQRKPNMRARAGEGDHHSMFCRILLLVLLTSRLVASKMPRHLFSGKRKSGKTNRR
jgi:nucleolar GTP-binding protein